MSTGSLETKIGCEDMSQNSLRCNHKLAVLPKSQDSRSRPLLDASVRRRQEGRRVINLSESRKMAVNGDFQLKSYWDQRYQEEGVGGKFDWFKNVCALVALLCARRSLTLFVESTDQTRSSITS